MKDWKKLLLDSNRMTGASKTLAQAHNELVRSIYGPLVPKEASGKKAPAKKDPKS